MSKTPMKEVVIQGMLLFPWRGQVRFSAALNDDGEIILTAGDQKYDRYFEHAHAVTVRRYTDVERELFASVEDRIKVFLTIKDDTMSALGDVINLGKAESRVSMDIYRLHETT